MVVNFNSVPVILFGAHCRGGIESVEDLVVLQALRRITDRGRSFVALADRNAATMQIEESGWLALLEANVIAAGVVTAVSREVDIVLVSQELSKAVMGIAASWMTPFSPHATVWLAMPFLLESTNSKNATILQYRVHEV